ncbi:16S rRNA (uracil(1498)-N(3))-methyltransferase [Planomicrobium sp. YIM 101495]|uniref:16S rRNA (uracil(1498)-N(3))-methyltransferase n=1 Tax=Planomicrobium sp. YIM 101495 TaxID=2665160 RepID=UPI0012B83643|nr:16S rRNA (uracil(1498)-N(3))-methyltransferase [Planomicrobium sp. YIM 101495]MTD30006.1 16S rRNA (uracil(1498)-N(3))-methyltransferase [Planomicrobium sp. YIM 101495]
MQRYFIGGDIPEDGIATITGDDAHHILKVMRQKAGEELVVVVQGTAFRSEIVEAEMDVSIRLGDRLEGTVELPVDVTIACGLPKGDKLELISQKATELGMYGLIPFAAERSIVRWDDKKSTKKVERLQKIAKEAAEQAHRTQVPVIHNAVSFKGLLAEMADYDAVVIAYEEEARSERRMRFAETVKSLYNKGSILLVFGPEGGLSEQEATALSAAGALFTSLGPRILRTETAPLYALAAISYEFE